MDNPTCSHCGEEKERVGTKRGKHIYQCDCMIDEIFPDAEEVDKIQTPHDDGRLWFDNEEEL